MCLLNFVLFFRINYKCNYGQALYVVGNISQLGNWNPSLGLKLDWTDGHNWTRKLSIIHDNTKMIEYKYFVGPDNISLALLNAHWESGINHSLSLITSSTLFVELNDEWEHSKIKIALKYDAIKKKLDATKRMIILTDLRSSNTKYEMKLDRGTHADGTIEDWFWTASFSVSNSMIGFHYRYKIEDEAEKEVWSDPVERRFVINRFSARSCLDRSHQINGSLMVKTDFLLKTSLSYNVITEDILVGTFPQDSKDISHIADLGVKGVLNLQTLNDMKRYGTDWECLQDSYKYNNLTVEHFPIRDMSLEDLNLKIEEAASILHHLLGQGKVYVHCTAGRFRSPNVIIWYLCHYKNYPLNHAIELIKSKRTKARIIKEVISKKYEKSLKNNALKDLSRT